MDELGRTLMTIGCTDCDDLPKVADAGRIVEGSGSGNIQIMHNGLKVVAGGYYGDWMAHIIRGLRGHHEPQEERIFAALVRYARHNSLIVELGCFWAYYSLWYLHDVPGSRAVCVEPDPYNIGIGRRNMALNGFEGRASFTEAWVGKEHMAALTLDTETAGPRTLPCLNMPAITALAGQPVEILHIDAQGAEHGFIQSMRDAAADWSVRFLVVSTHHRSISGQPDTHGECCDLIRSYGGHILAEHDVQESFSGDGLIVASFYPQDRGLIMPAISKNRPETSLFPVR